MAEGCGVMPTPETLIVRHDATAYDLEGIHEVMSHATVGELSKALHDKLTATAVGEPVAE
jgi:hypothetical protein